MALWLCRQCTAAYAVGLPACPQCASDEYQEEHMPKISRASGVTYEDGHAPEGDEPQDAVVEDAPAEQVEAKPAKRTGRKATAGA